MNKNNPTNLPQYSPLQPPPQQQYPHQQRLNHQQQPYDNYIHHHTLNSQYNPDNTYQKHPQNVNLDFSRTNPAPSPIYQPLPNLPFPILASHNRPIHTTPIHPQPHHHSHQPRSHSHQPHDFSTIAQLTTSQHRPSTEHNLIYHGVNSNTDANFPYSLHHNDIYDYKHNLSREKPRYLTQSPQKSDALQRSSLNNPNHPSSRKTTHVSPLNTNGDDPFDPLGPNQRHFNENIPNSHFGEINQEPIDTRNQRGSGGYQGNYQFNKSTYNPHSHQPSQNSMAASSQALDQRLFDPSAMPQHYQDDQRHIPTGQNSIMNSTHASVGLHNPSFSPQYSQHRFQHNTTISPQLNNTGLNISRLPQISPISQQTIDDLVEIQHNLQQLTNTVTQNPQPQLLHQQPLSTTLPLPVLNQTVSPSRVPPKQDFSQDSSQAPSNIIDKTINITNVHEYDKATVVELIQKYQEDRKTQTAAYLKLSEQYIVIKHEKELLHDKAIRFKGYVDERDAYIAKLEKTVLQLQTDKSVLEQANATSEHRYNDVYHQFLQLKYQNDHKEDENTHNLEHNKQSEDGANTAKNGYNENNPQILIQYNVQLEKTFINLFNNDNIYSLLFSSTVTNCPTLQNTNLKNDTITKYQNQLKNLAHIDPNTQNNADIYADDHSKELSRSDILQLFISLSIILSSKVQQNISQLQQYIQDCANMKAILHSQSDQLKSSQQRDNSINSLLYIFFTFLKQAKSAQNPSNYNNDNTHNNSSISLLLPPKYIKNTITSNSLGRLPNITSQLDNLTDPKLELQLYQNLPNYAISQQIHNIFTIISPQPAYLPAGSLIPQNNDHAANNNVVHQSPFGQNVTIDGTDKHTLLQESYLNLNTHVSNVILDESIKSLNGIFYIIICLAEQVIKCQFTQHKVQPSVTSQQSRELKSLTEELDNFKRQCEIYSRQNKTLSSQLVKYKQDIDDVTAIKDELQQKITDLEHNRAQLQSTCESLSNKAKIDLSRAQEEYTRLEQQHDTLKLSYDLIMETLNDLDQEAQNRLEGDSRKYDDIIKQHKSELDLNHDIIAQLRKRVGEDEVTILNLQQKNSDLSSQLQQSSQTLNQHIHDYESQIETFTKRCQEQSHALNEQKGDFSTLLSKHHQLTQDYEHLVQKAALLQDNHQKQLEVDASPPQDTKDLQAKLNEMTQQNILLSKKLEAVSKEIHLVSGKFSEQIDECERNLRMKEQEIAQLHHTIEKKTIESQVILQDEDNTVHLTPNEYSAIFSQHDERLQQIKIKYNNVKKSYNDLKDKYNTLVRDHSEIVKDYDVNYDELLTKYTKTNELYQVFKTKYDHVKDEFNTMSTKYNQLKDDFNIIYQKYMTLKNNSTIISSKFHHLHGDERELMPPNGTSFLEQLPSSLTQQTVHSNKPPNNKEYDDTIHQYTELNSNFPQTQQQNQHSSSSSSSSSLSSNQSLETTILNNLPSSHSTTSSNSSINISQSFFERQRQQQERLRRLQSTLSSTVQASNEQLKSINSQSFDL